MSAGDPRLTESHPAFRAAAVTPSDTTMLTTVARALYVGTGGDVVILGTDGVAVTFKNVATGAILPVVAARVNSTSTTASNVVALF